MILQHGLVVFQGNGSRFADMECIRVGSYSNPRIGSGWHSNTFIFSHMPWITASWTYLSVSPSCSGMRNCETAGRSTEFYPELSVAELSCSTGKTALHLPLSLRFKALDLMSTILLRFPTDGAKLFQNETGWGGTEAQTYVWLTYCWSGNDDVSSLRDLEEGLPHVFFPRKAPPMAKSVSRREIL